MGQANHPSTSNSDLARSYGVLAVLTLVMFVNYLDRFVMAILVEPIKSDLALTDSEVGLLTGLAFSLVYALCGLPIAHFADRGTRRTAVAGALAVWSVMTALCGLAQSFWQMFLARMGVGAGEAGAVPASHSMISDLFPLQRRATAMALFTAGGAAGMLGGFAIGGWLEAAVGWRGAFVAVGVPGLVLAILVRLVIHEPTRGRFAATDLLPHATSKSAIVDLLSNPVVRFMLLAQALSNLVTFGQLHWLPAFFERSFDMARAEIGAAIASTRGIGMIAGMICGGLLADRLSKRDRVRPVWLIVIAHCLALAPNVAIYMANDAQTAFMLCAIGGFISSLAIGPELATIQSSARPEQRATVSAMSMLVSGLIGIGCGPLIVGVLSDAIASTYGAESLRQALLRMVAVFTPLVIVAYLFARSALQRRVLMQAA